MFGCLHLKSEDRKNWTYSSLCILNVEKWKLNLVYVFKTYSYLKIYVWSVNIFLKDPLSVTNLWKNDHSDLHCTLSADPLDAYEPLVKNLWDMTQICNGYLLKYMVVWICSIIEFPTKGGGEETFSLLDVYGSSTLTSNRGQTAVQFFSLKSWTQTNNF